MPQQVKDCPSMKTSRRARHAAGKKRSTRLRRRNRRRRVSDFAEKRIYTRPVCFSSSIQQNIVKQEAAVPITTRLAARSASPPICWAMV